MCVNRSGRVYVSALAICAGINRARASSPRSGVRSVQPGEASSPQEKKKSCFTKHTEV